MIRAGDLGIPDGHSPRPIDGQIDRLEPHERTLLEVASVAGVTFSASVVADGGGYQRQAKPRAGLTALARRQRFVRRSDSLEGPDWSIVRR